MIGPKQVLWDPSGDGQELLGIGLSRLPRLFSWSITPIFTLSSVSGESLDLLKVFLNILPPLSNSKEQEELMQQLTEFQVDEIYSVPDVGTVVGGTLYSSVCTFFISSLSPLLNAAFFLFSMSLISLVTQEQPPTQQTTACIGDHRRHHSLIKGPQQWPAHTKRSQPPQHVQDDSDPSCRASQSVLSVQSSLLFKWNTQVRQGSLQQVDDGIIHPNAGLVCKLQGIHVWAHQGAEVPEGRSSPVPSSDMAAKNNLRAEDQFLCSICLDVFTDPVSTPCGHNFCKNCIDVHWNTTDQCLCPICKKVFSTKPELYINTLFSEMVAQFKSAQQEASSSSSEQQVSKPGEVPCDVCTGTKLKALKSCLVCLVSYCETHLEPHLTVSGLKRHQLMEPVENLEGRMCTKHDKPLELFCKTDQTCVCMLCSVLDHKTHEFVPLREEYEEKKAELGKTEAEIQQMIHKRRLKIEEIKRSVDLSEENADRETAEGVQVFTSLKESVERGLNELIHTIKEKKETTEKQAQAFIKELEQEISELMKRRTEVEEVSQSEDHLHLLQSVQSLNIHHPPPTKDWTEVSVRPSYDGTVRRAVTQLEETLSKEMKKLVEAELKKVQQYAVDVTLDPDTAHPELILSDDGKQVSHGGVWKKLPDNPERFSVCFCVLGKESFSSGRFYYEVQVKGKTEWDLGVATESIDRKGLITLSPEEGFWTIWLTNGNEYEALNDPSVRLSLKSRPQKVGVFVDYEEGLVSFYNVDTAALIYSFTGCSFREKLFPYFSPGLHYGGKNSAPLIISLVDQTA
ncbi:hypothetical protein L3Q82_020134 [Scortum barcoo]|uniref:Uncharacterized protein n=1 Tax=Scortum barcoo TaxID=214431 RepID=A0ACB8VAI2_9TELE|nr:hypothetical protein L3Q82_020134 [Scortum barcoo]